MNHNLLIALGICADDAPNAEKLLDWIYELNGKTQRGHILLAYAHDVHTEMKLKCKICAELAFESVSEFTATSRAISFNGADTKGMNVELKTKVEFVNNLWSQTARHVAGHFRFPWLWFEPDCVPITPDWIGKLSSTYANQPKKFLGRKMMRGEANNPQYFLSRIAVYPTSAYNELAGFVGSPPFEWAAGNHVLPRATTTKLIQPGLYDGEFEKIPAEAVVYHSDKTGKLIEQLREKKAKVSNGLLTTEYNQFADVERIQIRKELVIPILHKREVDVPMPEDNSRNHDPEPSDKRTKAWKDWNKRRQEVAA